MNVNAFLSYLWLQLKLDVRDRGTLLNFYLVPLLFFFVVGAVFASINPLMKTTLAASMSVFAVTMGAVMGFPTALVKLRETGTMRAFAVNGIPSSVVLAVHALSAFMHLLVVAIVIGLAAPSVYHASVPDNPSRYGVVLVVLLFASISIGLAIGVTAGSQSFTAMLSMLVFLPSLLFSGVMFPTSMLPKVLEWVGYIFPATYVLQSFYGWAYHVQTHMNPGVSLLAAITIGMALLTYALWKYGRNNKMEHRIAVGYEHEKTLEKENDKNTCSMVFHPKRLSRRAGKPTGTRNSTQIHPNNASSARHSFSRVRSNI